MTTAPCMNSDSQYMSQIPQHQSNSPPSEVRPDTVLLFDFQIVVWCSLDKFESTVHSQYARKERWPVHQKALATPDAS